MLIFSTLVIQTLYIATSQFWWNMQNVGFSQIRTYIHVYTYKFSIPLLSSLKYYSSSAWHLQGQAVLRLRCLAVLPEYLLPPSLLLAAKPTCMYVYVRTYMHNVYYVCTVCKMEHHYIPVTLGPGGQTNWLVWAAGHVSLMSKLGNFA